VTSSTANPDGGIEMAELLRRSRRSTISTLEVVVPKPKHEIGSRV
jgi:hypothetical protein